MKFEDAKCPNCGATLQLDNSLETGYCVYCGSKFMVREAIQRMKIEVSGQVSITGISTIENDIKLGQQCILAQDWKQAEDVFRLAISKKTNNFDAWFGWLTASTENYTLYNSIKGVYGFDSAFRNCMQYGDATQRKLVLKSINSLVTALQQKENEIFYNNSIEYKLDVELRKKRRFLGYLLIIPLAILFVMFLFDKEIVNTYGFIPVILFLIMFFWFINEDKPKGRLNERNLHDVSLVAQLGKVKGLLGE